MKKSKILSALLILVFVGICFAAYMSANYSEPGGNKWVIGGGSKTGELLIDTDGTLHFEGATANAYETAFAVTEPTADRTITLPDATGKVELVPLVVLVSGTDANDVTVAASATGTVYIADGNATDPNTVFDLPSAVAPTATSRLIYTFVDANATAATDVWIKAASGDTINGGTAAKYYVCRTATAGQMTTLVAVDVTRWVVVAEKGTWVNDND